MSQAEGFTSTVVCPCQTMQLAEQSQRQRLSIDMSVHLLGDVGEPVALEAAHVSWCISKRSRTVNVPVRKCSSQVNVTLWSVTSIRCCLCKVLENRNRNKTGKRTFQQVYAILGLSLSCVPAPTALAFSSSSNMLLCKSSLLSSYRMHKRRLFTQLLYAVLHDMQGAHASPLMRCCLVVSCRWNGAIAWVSGCRLGMTKAASQGWGGPPIPL